LTAALWIEHDNDNQDSEEEAIDCMAKNVMNFILSTKKKKEIDDKKEDTVATMFLSRRRASLKNGEQYGSTVHGSVRLGF
jgi:hypothetical protein